MQENKNPFEKQEEVVATKITNEEEVKAYTEKHGSDALLKATKEYVDSATKTYINNIRLGTDEPKQEPLKPKTGTALYVGKAVEDTKYYKKGDKLWVWEGKRYLKNKLPKGITPGPESKRVLRA